MLARCIQLALSTDSCSVAVEWTYEDATRTCTLSRQMFCKVFLPLCSRQKYVVLLALSLLLHVKNAGMSVCVQYNKYELRKKNRVVHFWQHSMLFWDRGGIQSKKVKH